MKLTINIKEECKVNFILKLMQSFDFVEIIDNPEFTPEQQLEKDRRLDMFQKEERKLDSWDEMKSQIQIVL
jgi:hypothetical protein